MATTTEERPMMVGTYSLKYDDGTEDGRPGYWVCNADGEEQEFHDTWDEAYAEATRYDRMDSIADMKDAISELMDQLEDDAEVTFTKLAAVIAVIKS